jgi:hypothetical protein
MALAALGEQRKTPSLSGLSNYVLEWMLITLPDLWQSRHALADGYSGSLKWL